MNTHQADNLKIFDYLKNDDTNSDLINSDSLKYIFIENQSENNSKDNKELGNKILDKITDKFDSLLDSAADAIKKKESK